MRVPTRSEGTRSGVNWTRENVPPSTPAVVLIVRVFASPGTPSIRRWPWASRQTRTRSSIASCPAITRRISNSACSRRSLASAGAGTGRSSAGEVTSPPWSRGVEHRKAGFPEYWLRRVEAVCRSSQGRVVPAPKPSGMVVLRRQETWPDGRRRLRIRWGRLARFTVPVLVVAAGLFGAAVSAAILVGVWDKEAGRRHALEGKLATSQDRVKALTQESKRLERRLAASRATSARLERSAARLGTAAQALLRENTALVASASRLHDRSGSVERRAASVSRTAATLGNDLVAVLAYITSTSADSLDPSYLKAQLDYLR